MKRLALALAASVAFYASPALAHPHYHSHHHRYEHVWRHRAARWRGFSRPWGNDDGKVWGRHDAAGWGGRRGYIGGGNDARARAQGLPDCGAYMADLFGFVGKVGRELWVAANWAHMGHATEPHPGAVAVWRHHVVKIVGGQDGHDRWLVQDNHGRGGSHTYYRSLHGVIAIRDIGGTG